MRIENFRLDPALSRQAVLALFDVSVSEDVTLRNWILRRNHEGEVRCSPPATRSGGRPVSLSPRIYHQILDAATEAFRTASRSPSAHDNSNAA